MKKQQRKQLLLLGGIVLIAVLIFTYGKYGLEVGKFFAAERVPSKLIRCTASQSTILSGKPVMFTAYLMTTPTPLPSRIVTRPGIVDGTSTPTPTAIPTLTRRPVATFVWSTADGNPARGSGTQFTTIFSNSGTVPVTKVVTLTYGAERTTCSVSVYPLPPVATSLRIITPNGGQSYFSGQTVTVQWSATGFAADAKVGLQLSYMTPTGLRYEDVIASNLSASTGAYRWLIPTKYGGSAYQRNEFKMRVVLLADTAPGGAIGDYSDATFTINMGPTPTMPSPSPSLPPPSVPTTPAPSKSPIGYRYTCINKACVLVTGAGLDDCNVDADCEF